MAKMHSGEAFYSFDDPLEAAVFSALVELMRADRLRIDGNRHLEAMHVQGIHGERKIA